MAATHPMTLEELQNNYEYKVARRLAMKEYKWIIDIAPPPDDEELNKYNIIFLICTIDTQKFMEEYECDMMGYVKHYLSKGEQYSSPYLGLIFNISAEEGNEIHDDVVRDMQLVGETTAFPRELKIPNYRKLNISSYIVKP